MYIQNQFTILPIQLIRCDQNQDGRVKFKNSWPPYGERHWYFRMINQNYHFYINMGKQGEHHDAHHQENGHSEHSSHHASDPFTDSEKVLIEMAHKTQKFQAHHHHHHHHEHVEYRRPFNIDTNLGLFALKKLNAMNPEYLREKDKRLLNPSGPGVITHLIHGAIFLTTPIYSYTVWSNFGAKAFLRPAVILPLAALFGTNIFFQHVANYMRELTLAPARKSMVSYYKDQLGQKFLIDVLEPTFRLPSELESK